LKYSSFISGSVVSCKTVQVLYCHSAVPIPQNGPVTVLSQCSSYTTKSPVTALSQCSSYTRNRSSYCIVTIQFLYYKTVQLLYCHSAVTILKNGPVTAFSPCSSYTTKRSSYSIVTVQFLYRRSSNFPSLSNARTPSGFPSALLQQIYRNLNIYLR